MSFGGSPFGGVSFGGAEVLTVLVITKSARYYIRMTTDVNKNMRYEIRVPFRQTVPISFERSGMMRVGSIR